MFFQGGGFPFGFDDADDADYQQQQQQSYYDILQLSTQATLQQIQKQFHALTQRYQAGAPEEDIEKLQQVRQAYQILSNPQQRKMYDMSLKTNQKNNLKKVPPTKMHLPLTLQQIYQGKQVPFKYQIARLCKGCNGKGGQNVKKCTTCKGKGGVVKLVPVGPGMYAQSSQVCQSCKGQGDIFEQGEMCKQCLGKKISKVQVEVIVPVPISIPANQAITMRNEGNIVPDMNPGDLILIVQQKVHQVFSRKGADLFMKKSLTLIQALLGFKFTIRHLNERQYTVITKPGQIIGDGQKKIIIGLGMPYYQQIQTKGNLIIEFKVVMPKKDQITKQQLQLLTKILPGNINSRPKSDNYQMLQDFDKQQMNTNQQGGKKADQQQQEGESVGCQAQ